MEPGIILEGLVEEGGIRSRQEKASCEDQHLSPGQKGDCVS
jgi:hypothetical protein